MLPRPFRSRLRLALAAATALATAVLLPAGALLNITPQPAGGSTGASLPADPNAQPPNIPYLVLRLAPDHSQEKDLSALTVTERGGVLLSFNAGYSDSSSPVVGYRWRDGHLQSLQRSSNEAPPYPDSVGRSRLYDMNDAGVVVGHYSHADPLSRAWSSTHSTYIYTGCYWPAEQAQPQTLPAPYSAISGGYTAFHITDTGALHGVLLDHKTWPGHSVPVTYDYGLTWSSTSAVPALNGAAWNSGNSSQIARFVTAVSPNGLHTLGRETYRAFDSEGRAASGSPPPPKRRNDLLLDITRPAVSINDSGRWITTRYVSTPTIDRSFIYWAEDRVTLLPVDFGLPYVINNAHDILGGNGGGEYYIWKWLPDPSFPPAYHYVKHKAKPTIPTGWALHDINIRDFTTSGFFAGRIRKTHDDLGQPLPSNQQTTAPVLFMPMELTSEDRLIKGAITLPEGWTNVSLSFRATSENGLDLGTFDQLEPEATESPTYVYASEEDILSDDEVTQTLAGTIDPRANTQAVVFHREAGNPRRLHFATVFDQAGEIEITLAIGPPEARITASLRHTLVAQEETAGLLAILDQRIESIDIPEIPDFDLDTDGDGVPDGGSSDLIAAAQPGTMSSPVAYVSEAAEDDPLNLLLLVNSDDDNTDLLPDSQHSALDPADDDLARVVLRTPADLASLVGTLTLTHTGGPALRLRFPTGPPIASGTSVDLASPTGPLAALTAGPLTLYAEGLVPAADVAITLSYTPAGQSTPTLADSVHLTVLDPAALAALQTRHRYFAKPGDLGGLVSRAYAANGSYRQHRLGPAPIGESIPVQFRNLVTKTLAPTIGALKSQAAFLRGTADGFWLGLKSDGEGVADIVIFLQEDNKIARAKALWEQFKVIREEFEKVKAAELPALMLNMAGTITRDLYTDAEAELGWAPLQPGWDPQVIAYAAGLTNGYLGEQIVVSLIPLSGPAIVVTSKIGPVFKGVITAAKNAERYVLTALNAVRKAAAKMMHNLPRIGRTTEEIQACAHAVQQARKLELPGGAKVLQVLDDWFTPNPQLREDVLRIWADTLPVDVTDKRLTHMLNDLATVMHRFGDATELPDDALKGFAHLQAKLFKTGDDTISRWDDCVKLFGELNTPGKRNALKESLLAYKQAVELNPAAKFWIKNIDAIQPEAYRYSSFIPPNGWGSYNGLFPDLSDPWYCSFNKVHSPELANDLLLLPGNTRNPRYRFEFETQSVMDKSRFARGQGDIDPHYEPLTREVPTGANPHIPAGSGVNGGGTQFFVEGEFPISKVIDMVTNQQVWP